MSSDELGFLLLYLSDLKRDFYFVYYFLGFGDFVNCPFPGISNFVVIYTTGIPPQEKRMSP